MAESVDTTRGVVYGRVRERRMSVIALTRMNGAGFVVNAELIKYVEEVPDTIVTLRDGEKLLVRETPDMVVAKVVAYGRALRLVAE